MIVVRSGAPARLAGVLVPLIAVGLVVARLVASGLSSGPDDPASPWIVAVLTVVVGCVLGWRALSQRAELRPDVLACRNVIGSFAVDWERVESIAVLRRGPLVVFDVRVRGLRRRLRIGAATRYAGVAADAVLDMLRAHPSARTRLVSDGPSGR